MENPNRKFNYLEIPDVTNFIFLCVLSILSLIFVKDIFLRFTIVGANLVLIVIINFIVKIYETGSDKESPSIKRFFRYWYPVFMILLCFKEIYVIMLDSADGRLCDQALIDADRFLFTVDPTVFLSDYGHPLLTEFLQVIYFAFYFIPIIFSATLYFSHKYEEFKYAMFIVFTGFYLSFIGYLLVPAIGPRFTLHEFGLLDSELPGIFLTELMRNIINFAESIPAGVSNPQDYAQRDAFPSGHTIIIVLITYLAYKFRFKSAPVFMVYTILMIFSTVYLRYHYVIDLISAVPFVLITIFLGNHLFKKKSFFNEHSV